MPERHYIQHGSRHRTAGSDPIPGLGGGMKWASISMNAIVSLNAGTSRICDMLTGSFYTNDTATFSVETWVHSAVTYHGIGTLVDGHYLAKGRVQLNSASSAASGYVNALYVNNPGLAATYNSGGVFEDFPTATSNGQRSYYVESLCTVNGGSTNPFIMQIQNTTAVNLTVFTDIIVFQLDTDNTLI